MTDVQFGRLLDLPLSQAWRNEAQEFTPWLAENIDHLAEAIGVPLELTGTEVAVESFSADILARNPIDDSVVLIENQLEKTDHTHLGQIMTYLAGLEAQTVIWIAPSFRQPHLSAIRWLNEHTAEGFSFFAVRARVVRIGDSPFAPIFEVVEKPDDWSRQLKSEARGSDLKSLRRAYFDRLNEELSGISVEREGQQLFISVGPESGLNIVLEIHRTRVSVHVTSQIPIEYGELTNRILKCAPQVESELAPIRETRWGGALYRSTACNLDLPETWPATVAWHKDQVQSYLRALASDPGDA